MKELRCLVVDDSLLYRSVLSDLLESIPGCTVVGTASNGRMGVQRALELQPDLVTLDVEMPIMNGLETLVALKEKGCPADVLMLSSLTAQGAEVTLEALKRGAVDFLEKPSLEDSATAQETLVRQLRAKIELLHTRRLLRNQPARSAVAPQPTIKRSQPRQKPAIVVIGVSTGGPAALPKVLECLPKHFPLPIVIVQHMPPLFVQSLAESLQRSCVLPIHIPKDQDQLKGGHVYLAPGGLHLALTKSAVRGTIARTLDTEPEHFCKPAVDVLFRSASQEFGPQCLGVILTGMGKDGAAGLLQIRQAGGQTLGQDAETCTVYGMPMEAHRLGAVEEQLPLSEIGKALIQRCL